MFLTPEENRTVFLKGWEEKKNIQPPRILYQFKISFKKERKIKICSENLYPQKLSIKSLVQLCWCDREISRSVCIWKSRYWIYGWHCSDQKQLNPYLKNADPQTKNASQYFHSK